MLNKQEGKQKLVKRHCMYVQVYYCPWLHYLGNEIHCLGSQVLTAVVEKSSIFWDKWRCSPLSVNRRFGGIYRLHLQMICSSETSVDTQRTTRRHIPEDSTLQNSLLLGRYLFLNTEKQLKPVSIILILIIWTGHRYLSEDDTYTVFWEYDLHKSVVFNFFVRLPPDIISLQLCTLKAFGV
jgi:hypothetical protein